MSKDIEIDFDSDGKSDVILKKTNGNELFISVKLLLKFGSVVIAAISALWFGVIN